MIHRINLMRYLDSLINENLLVNIIFQEKLKFKKESTLDPREFN